MSRRARHTVLFLILTLSTCGFACAPGADGDDGRVPVRLYLLLISAKQVEHYRWVEQTFEEQNPDVDVIFEQFPGSSLKDFEIKLKLRLASGKAPDVVGMSYTLAEELARLQYLARAPSEVEARVQGAARNEMIRSAPYFGGQCYGIVSDATPTVLYYNRSMFKEAGLDPDNPPASMDRLLQMADALTVRDGSGQPTRAGLSLRKTGFKPGIAEKWLTFLFSEGGEAFTPDGRRALFNNEQGRRALEMYRKVLFDKQIDSVKLEGDQQGFGQKKVAMFIREVHVIRWLQENYPDLDFGVAPIPAGTRSISAGGPYMFAVPSDSKHQDEAWRLITYLMSDPVYTRYSEIGGIVPTTSAVASLPQFRDDPMLNVFVRQEMKSVKPFPRFFQVMEILGAYIERFCYGQLTVEETLDRAEAEINALLAVA